METRKRPATLLIAGCLLLLCGPAAAQPSGPLKPTQEPGGPTQSVQTMDARGGGMPREIGEILETTEAARQSGVMSLRYIRRVGGAIYDWVDHLRISIVENDVPGTVYDRQNCELLYELIEQTSPSVILGRDLAAVREQVALGDAGDPTAAYLTLQLDIEKFRFLYPLLDLGNMARAILQLERAGRQSRCLETIDALGRAVALPNIDGPVGRSRRDFNQGLQALDAGQTREARQLLKTAASYITQVSVGTYLAESSWFLAKSDDALRAGLGAIALASVRSADTCLKDAQDRSWREFKPRVTAVYEDSGKLIGELQDRSQKGTLTVAVVRNLARRIDTELRFPE